MPNARSRPDDPHPPGVTVLRWPDQDDERRRLAALGRPRMLLTAPGVTPPSLLDDREVWMPEDRAAATFVEAMERLDRIAALSPDRPLIDADGLLRHAGRWIEIPPSQQRVVALLVQNYRRLVTNDALRVAYTSAERSASSGSIAGLVHRLTTRVRKVGLDLRRVYGRGLILGPGSGDGPGDRPVDVPGHA